MNVHSQPNYNTYETLNDLVNLDTRSDKKKFSTPSNRNYNTLNSNNNLNTINEYVLPTSEYLNNLTLENKSKEDFVKIISKLHLHNEQIRESYFQEKNKLLNIISKLERKNNFFKEEIKKYLFIKEQNTILQNEIESLKKYINEIEANLAKKIKEIKNQYKNEYENIIESLKNKNEYLSKSRERSKSFYVKEMSKIVENSDKETNLCKQNKSENIYNKKLIEYKFDIIQNEIKILENTLKSKNKLLKDLQHKGHNICSYHEKEINVMNSIENLNEELLKLKKNFNQLNIEDIIKG
jgi:hypothetical protein